MNIVKIERIQKPLDVTAVFGNAMTSRIDGTPDSIAINLSTPKRRRSAIIERDETGATSVS